MFSSQGTPLIDYEECLNERKWWCFLLSSIFTFLLGLLSVLATRLAQSYLCSQGEVDPTSAEEKQRLKEEAKKLRLQGQNPDEAPDGDFMSEAKVKHVSLDKISN